MRHLFKVESKSKIYMIEEAKGDRLPEIFAGHNFSEYQWNQGTLCLPWLLWNLKPDQFGCINFWASRLASLFFCLLILKMGIDNINFIELLVGIKWVNVHKVLRIVLHMWKFLLPTCSFFPIKDSRLNNSDLIILCPESCEPVASEPSGSLFCIHASMFLSWSECIV